MKKIPNHASIGGIIHDDGGGQVRRWISREPPALYRMLERDQTRMMTGMPVRARAPEHAGIVKPTRAARGERRDWRTYAREAPARRPT